MRVNEILKKLKANRYTYYNLSKEQIDDFKKMYNYLKSNKNRDIRQNIFAYSDALKGQINYWLNHPNELDYVKKYKAMELIAYNLK